MKLPKKQMMIKIIVPMALGLLVACGEDTAGPSVVNAEEVNISSEEVNVSSEEVNVSSEEVSVSSSALASSASETDPASSVAEKPDPVEKPEEPVGSVSLMTLDSSIYDNDVYVSLEGEEATIITNKQWDIEIAQSGIKTNTAVVGGLHVVDKSFDDVAESDLPTDDTAWEAKLVGKTVPYSTQKTFIAMFPGEFNHMTREYGAPSYRKFALTYNPTTHATGVVQSDINGDNKKEVSGYGLYSLQEGKNVELAIPEKWDILFGGYKTLLEGGTEYSVRGALTNQVHKIEVAIDTVTAWKDISADAAYEYSDKIDAIGHAWKSYSGGAYQVPENKIYVLKYDDGKMYKLKFLNFYNENSTQGFPQFQYQLIAE
jgi:hypothetical protein